MNLSKLAKYFSDEDAARDLLEEMRWGKDGAVCPKCGGADPYKITPKAGSKTRKGLYKCRACRKQFTVTVGTVFEDSHIPLSKWLLAIHLLASSKKGMSAHQLHRNLGISYKAAWFMAHRLRYAMKQGPMAALLEGVVEVDETYVGSKVKPGYRRAKHYIPKPKAPVVALVERETGRVRAMPMARVNANNLWKAIDANVAWKKSLVVTDEAATYGALGLPHHETVNHHRGEYVRGAIHTNTVEGFFSLLKRGINGVYHHVSAGHLERYCDEFAFRYENRKVSDGERATALVGMAEGKRLTFKQPASVS
ncbi:MAG TPA: IS1595 family transposase [Vicinamibacterales bacterium]|nr:IS1595 family transposase [Vicinamibacterales bacterium]